MRGQSTSMNISGSTKRRLEDTVDDERAIKRFKGDTSDERGVAECDLKLTKKIVNRNFALTRIFLINLQFSHKVLSVNAEIDNMDY